MKHKHYDLILAWANGAKIECNNNQGIVDHQNWIQIKNPRWYEYHEYRLMVEPEVMVSITHENYDTRYYPQPIQSIEDAMKLLPEVTSELFYVDIRTVHMCGWISRQDNPLFERDLSQFIKKGILHKNRINAIKHACAVLNLAYDENFN